MSDTEKETTLLDDEGIDRLLPALEEYEAEATPLTTAAQLREREELALREVLQEKAQTFSNCCETALKVIGERLPQMLSTEAWEAFREDFKGIGRYAKPLEEYSETQIEHATAETCLAEIYDLSATTLDAMTTLGDTLVAEEDYEAAEAVFGLETTLVPILDHAWTQMGVCLIQQERLEEAAEALAIAVTLAPNKITNLAFLAITQRMLGNADEAAAISKQVTEQAAALTDEERSDLEELLKAA